MLAIGRALLAKTALVDALMKPSLGLSPKVGG